MSSVKSYMWPIPEDHSDVVLCGVGGSVPSRVVFGIAVQFDLPVDLCGVTFDKDLYSPECLKHNPIHSMPFMLVYDQEDKTKDPVCINGSEAIASFLVKKFRDRVPQSFLPDDPLAFADTMQKVEFITQVFYRATMYQYVYPLMGLMTECQYDICKRDFALQIVEDWAAKGSPFFQGSEPSLADFYLHSIWHGNNMVMNDDFKNLPWRHKDVIDKYPATKALLEAVDEQPGPKVVRSQVLGEGDASVELCNSTGMFGMILKELPGNGRKFVYADGGNNHPNFVAYSQDKEKIDKPMTL